MMLFSQKEAVKTLKMSFYYSRKNCIFLNGLTYDTRQKFQISFEPTFLLKETMVRKQIKVFYRHWPH